MDAPITPSGTSSPCERAEGRDWLSGSALALAQATLVRDAFERIGQPSRIVIIETEGDRRAPDTAWGEGAFVAAIERALLDGRVDVAVHSAKDIPTDEESPAPHRRLPASGRSARCPGRPRRGGVAPARGSPAGLSGWDRQPTADRLPSRLRPDLVVHPLHGNVDTRLRRLDDGETDALVLACAGLDRLGRGHRIAERLAPETVPPAPGQGAIASRSGRTTPDARASRRDR
jgi:hydroxymethylbilane synthase